MSADPKQMNLEVVVHKEVGGLEMGVLRDGTPYLYGRGLAALCAVSQKAIQTLAQEYSPRSGKLRSQAIAKILEEQGYTEPSIYVETRIRGQTVHAFPDVVCMAVLEYYAFEARDPKPLALERYRTLARHSLKEFIYTQVGYDPNDVLPQPWNAFHQRVLLNTSPVGYFSVFEETAAFVITAIRHGLVVDQHTVPDISVGVCWGRYWTLNNLTARFGDRMKYPHVYPDDFPQSQAEPDAWVYPNEALGEFRTWLLAEYIPDKFPKYMRSKAKQGALPPSRAALMITAVSNDLGSGSPALPASATPPKS